MSKFKNATKRITAVAASAVMVSSAAFAAGLGDYPNNFVSNGKFDGQVVIGADAASIDSTSAASIIDDLAAELSGDSEKVKITAKKTSNGGDSISAVDAKETLNFGETLASVADDLDDGVSSLLADGDLNNDDYTQELFVQNGEFSYRIFDEVNGETVAKAGLYYAANTEFMQYTLDFEDEPSIASPDDEDLIGEEMTIMGNSFTVVEIAEEKLTLIGGSNKVALGEGETTTVSVNGADYEVSIQSVGTSEVLLTVNGESQSIDEFDVEEVAGVTIAVTDLVDSSRDAVKGYAEVVVGGQKVELTPTSVKVNDEDLEDVYPEYEVDVTFLGTNTDTVFAGVTIAYSVDDNVVLGAGDSLTDVLFDSFSLVYEGLNDAEYSEFSISTSTDDVTFDGNLFDGTAIPTEFKLTTDDILGNESLYLGTDSKRVYFSGSDLGITALKQADRMDAIYFEDADSNGAADGDVGFDVAAATTDVQGTMFFSRLDDDEFYLYEITGVDDNNLELDFEDIIGGKATNAVDYDDVDGSLEFPTVGLATSQNALLNDTVHVGAVNSNFTMLTVGSLGTAELYLENELTMDFSGVEAVNFVDTSDVPLVFTYNSDVDMDDVAHESDSFTLLLNRVAAPDFDTDAITMTIQAGHNFTSSDEVEEDSDYDVYVDHYGTMLTLNTQDYDSVTIAVPDKEVEGLVSVVFGDVAAETVTVTVDAADAEDKRAELIADGYSIVSSETVTSEAVEFDVTAAVKDSAVSGTENMIVVGGPAVNKVAAELLGMSYPTYGSASGVDMGEAVIRFFEDSNSVLVYGYEGADTAAAASKLNAGGLSGSSVDVQ